MRPVIFVLIQMKIVLYPTPPTLTLAEAYRPGNTFFFKMSVVNAILFSTHWCSKNSVLPMLVLEQNVKD